MKIGIGRMSHERMKLEDYSKSLYTYPLMAYMAARS